ncbi:MAG: tetratricopeptide repeat protein [Zetaproteobacteria bacterium]|nr:MAG: tetratricopeptide repeat protein [Zetaproteobacteria bacterium]
MRNLLFIVFFLVPLLLLDGCSSMQMPAEIRSLSFLNTYESAVHDFKNGRVMEARKKLLAFDKNNPDFQRAQAFLRKTVEPARMRLLRTYLQRAEQAKKEKNWSVAVRNYQQAVNLSDHPAELKTKLAQAELALRQYRFEHLLRQRREEDRALLMALDALAGLRGLDAQDPVLVAEREYRMDRLEDRARDAYHEAMKHLRHGLPEMAYVAIESYLRLVPDSDQGKTLKRKILSQMPKGMVIPPMNKGVMVKKALNAHQKVTRKDIEALIRKGRYREAREAAIAYRRAGGSKGDELLEKVGHLMDRQAAAYYEKGRAAFRQEKLDEAVRYWRLAVELRPDRAEYVEALRRAELLKERLDMLR